jgi:CheY-like chemotaxis protein
MKMAIPVLIVDSDDEYRKLMASTLDDTGQFRAYPAGSAGEAITLLTRQSVQIAIVDIDLPDLDGTEFLKELREINRHLLMIAIVENEQKQAPLFSDASVAAVIEKPFFLPELPTIIQNAIHPPKRQPLDGERSESTEETLTSPAKTTQAQATDVDTPRGMTDFLKSFDGQDEPAAEPSVIEPLSEKTEALETDSDLADRTTLPDDGLPAELETASEGVEFPEIFTDLGEGISEPPDPVKEIDTESADPQEPIINLLSDHPEPVIEVVSDPPLPEQPILSEIAELTEIPETETTTEDANKTPEMKEPAPHEEAGEHFVEASDEAAKLMPELKEPVTLDQAADHFAETSEKMTPSSPSIDSGMDEISKFVDESIPDTGQFIETYSDPAGEIPIAPPVIESQAAKDEVGETSSEISEELMPPSDQPAEDEEEQEEPSQELESEISEPPLEDPADLPKAIHATVETFDEVSELAQTSPEGSDDLEEHAQDATQAEPDTVKPEMDVEAGVRETEAPTPAIVADALEDVLEEAQPDVGGLREPGKVPPWLDDNFRAGEYLTTLFSEHSARGLLLIRDRNLWAFSSQFSEDQAQLVAETFLEHETSREPMEAIVRYIKIDPEEGDVLLYAVPIIATLILVLIYDGDKSFGLARRQANALSQQLATQEPTQPIAEEMPPVEEPDEAPAVSMTEEPLTMLPDDWIPVAPASDEGLPILDELDVPPPDPEPGAGASPPSG